MITEKDLQEAIAECEGKRNPDANTCIKLAAFYTIKEHLFPDSTKIESKPAYSFAVEPAPKASPRIDYQSETEFSRKIDGADPAAVWPIVDELVTAVQVTNPRLYRNFMRKLDE